MAGRPLRIATRGSRLALWQAQHVAGLLRQSRPEREILVIPVSTTGDRDQSEPLHRLGTTGVFTREVQKAVLDGRADVAVHSLKDLPTTPTPGLTLAAVPVRGPAFDVLLTPATEINPAGLDALPKGARIGTGSHRRRAQLLHRRPDLIFAPVRGNVETRLKKLDELEFQAVVLASAGIERLGLSGRPFSRLEPPLMYPAAGQGAIGVECRTDDAPAISLLQRINHPVTFRCMLAERTLLAELRAGCHAPVGVATRSDGASLHLEAVVLSSDGTRKIAATVSGNAEEAILLGRQAAGKLQSQGADMLIIAAAEQRESGRPPD